MDLPFLEDDRGERQSGNYGDLITIHETSQPIIHQTNQAINHPINQVTNQPLFCQAILVCAALLGAVGLHGCPGHIVLKHMQQENKAKDIL